MDDGRENCVLPRRSDRRKHEREGNLILLPGIEPTHPTQETAPHTPHHHRVYMSRRRLDDSRG